jgi:hypothetical protein
MDTKKKAAAMAAVVAYMTDAEQSQTQSRKDRSKLRSQEPDSPCLLAGSGLNIWGLTGRQAMMQANTMIQMRMFK